MKLTDVKVIYICPDHNEKYNKRKIHMDSLLHRIGFTDIVHYVSGTENYPACLINATMAILQKYMYVPFLLLEDDVEFTDIYEFDYNKNVDAIYFGLSKYAGSLTRNSWEGLAIHEKYSQTQTRVLNMLGAHAIFYNSVRYKQAIIDILSPYKEISYNSDVLISRIQKNYLVLAEKNPFFYQSSKFNKENQEDATRISLL
jgi:hypothetical protein